MFVWNLINRVWPCLFLPLFSQIFIQTDFYFCGCICIWTLDICAQLGICCLCPNCSRPVHKKQRLWCSTHFKLHADQMRNVVSGSSSSPWYSVNANYRSLQQLWTLQQFNLGVLQALLRYALPLPSFSYQRHVWRKFIGFSVVLKLMHAGFDR